MLTIKKITVENFRGIRLPLTLEFYKGSKPTSAILYGRNGTGKSSIIDAWEWLITFGIKELNKENVSPSDYPHKLSNGDDCSIKVDFEHPSVKSVSATYNKKKITVPTTGGQYADFKKLTVYPNYLRYSDLQEFVYFSKTDKYKFIARFFGLESFMKNQGDLQSSITKLKTQLLQNETSLAKDVENIREFISLGQIDDITVVTLINTIASRHSIQKISRFKDATTVKTALEALIRQNPVATELAAWLAFQARLDNFYPLPDLKELLVELEDLFSELKKDEQNITKIILTDLYEKGLSILEIVKEKSTCPLCDSTFVGDIVEHIKNKHTALKELQSLKSKFDKKKLDVEKIVQQIQKKITGITGENNTIVLQEFEDFFKDIKSISEDLPTISDEINKNVTELSKLETSTNNAVTNVDKLITVEIQNKEKVKAKIAALNGDIASKNLADDLSTLVRIIPAYISYLKNDGKCKYLQEIIGNADTVYNNLTGFIQAKIQSTFTAIQTDLSECYNILEDTNVFLKNPEIKLVTGKDRAVELEIEFVGNKITPAFKVMSESQVNSFGLAIFLSAVRYFNPNFKFVILDDIVNSFDAFKRPKVATLLSKKFSDFQCLILSHDQVFFDTIQKVFPSWHRYKFTSWDYTNGPKFKLSRSYAEDIQHHIDEDEAIKAGQTLGRYLEWILGMVNERIETPLKYKIENTYTLMEFYEPLAARLNTKLKQNGKTHKLLNEFSQIDQGTIFRNYCAHWKDESSPFTTPEIDGVFKKWTDIEKMMFCEACKSLVQYTKKGSDEYIKCECGKLDLKDSSFYV